MNSFQRTFVRYSSSDLPRSRHSEGPSRACPLWVRIKRSAGNPLTSPKSVLVTDSLCQGQEKRTMHNSEVQIGNSGQIPGRGRCRRSKCGQSGREATNKTRSCDFHPRAASLQGKTTAVETMDIRPASRRCRPLRFSKLPRLNAHCQV